MMIKFTLIVNYRMESSAIVWWLCDPINWRCKQ